MTEIVLKAGREFRGFWDLVRPKNSWRLLLLAIVLFLAAGVVPGLHEPTVGALADAYLAVTVFVAATLAMVFLFERGLNVDLGQVMVRAGRWQAPMASLLGALPGCGGAIVVVTQYARGYASFGSLVAVLIATMGDAAFILIAREPITGLAIMAMGLVVGTISGWVVDALHGQDFLRAREPLEPRRGGDSPEFPEAPASVIHKSWAAFVIPCAAIGLALAFQLDVDSWFGSLAAYEPTKWLGVSGALICLTMWAFARKSNAQLPDNAASPECTRPMGVLEQVVRDTNFVTSWVIVGFLSYEILVHFAGSGVETWFKVYGPFVPLMAVLIGFVPGCGPQIVTTTLYLNGAIPLSAQLGNAIANDGDALFPAIALAPRAAFWATIYSAVPALIIAYGWMFLFEMGR